MRLPWKLCLEQSMLSVKCIYAFNQTSFCLLSNVNMIVTKYYLIQRIAIPQLYPMKFPLAHFPFEPFR